MVLSQPTKDASGTRLALLQAAEELFAQDGYEAVGIRDIAARAGTNVSSIKYHFGSKRELYLETIRCVLLHPDIQASWDAFDPLPSDPQQAATLLFQFVKGALHQAHAGGRPGRCVRLMLLESLRPGDDFEFITSKFSSPFERLMVDLIRVIAPGRGPVFHTAAGRGVFAQVLHYHTWRSFIDRSEFGALGSDDFPLEAAAEEAASFILRGLGCSEPIIENAMASVP